MGRPNKKLYEYRGKMCTCEELARMAGISYQVMWARINYRHMTPEAAVERGACGPRCDRPNFWRHSLGGEKMSMDAISQRLHLSKGAIWYRAKTRGLGIQTVINEEYERQRRGDGK